MTPFQKEVVALIREHGGMTDHEITQEFCRRGKTNKVGGAVATALRELHRLKKLTRRDNKWLEILP